MMIRVLYVLSTKVVLMAIEASGTTAYNPLKLGLLEAHQSAIFPTMAAAEVIDPSGIVAGFMIENNIDPENP